MIVLPENKYCPRCKEIKNISEFGFEKRAKDGLRYYCKKCNNAYSIRYYSEPNHKINRNNFWKNSRRKDPRKHLLALAKKRSKANEMVCNIELSDIFIPKVCPILGLEIQIADGNPNDCSPSIDRINNSRGYEKDNIIVVSKRVNTIKNSASLDEMKLVFDNFNSISKNINSTIEINRIKELLRSAKKRAKNNNLNFNLDLLDIKIPYYCPILNLSLEFSKKILSPNSPSLDRLEPSKGYVKDNIRVISHRANSLKNNSSYEEYTKIYEFYKNLFNSKV